MRMISISISTTYYQNVSLALSGLILLIRNLLFLVSFIGRLLQSANGLTLDNGLIFRVVVHGQLLLMLTMSMLIYNCMNYVCFFHYLYIFEMHRYFRAYLDWLDCRLGLRVTCNQSLELIL